MHRTTLLLITLLLGAASRAEPPNIILILADDLGYGGLNCYGTEWLETPNIDSLCRQGMKFTDGLAAYPVCKPSRMAILTGQYGPRTGSYRVVDRHQGQEDLIRFVLPKNEDIAEDKITIAECFQQAGYATAAYGKWHVGPEWKPEGHPTQHGFDEGVAVTGHFTPKAYPPFTLEEGEITADYCTARARAFMTQSTQSGKPFFLYLPYYLVHKPLEAKPEYIEHFRAKLKDVPLRHKKPEETVIVGAMTRMLDDCVGKILEQLKQLGVEENTLVVFTSDNGAFTTDLTGPTRGQKGDTYQGGMKVPYIFRWPGRIQAGSTCDERIIGIDLYPTLLSMAGIAPPANHPLDGVDLSPVLTGATETLAQRPVYCFWPKYAQFDAKRKRWKASWRNVMYAGSYKLIEYPEYDEYELFNLTEDPEETTSLADTKPERLRILTHALHQWIEDSGAPKLEPNPNYSLK